MVICMHCVAKSNAKPEHLHCTTYVHLRIAVLVSLHNNLFPESGTSFYLYGNDTSINDEASPRSDDACDVTYIADIDMFSTTYTSLYVSFVMKEAGDGIQQDYYIQ